MVSLSIPETNSYVSSQDIWLEYLNPRTGTRTKALAGLDLQMRAGEFLTIVGPSGCGKTSFLNIVAGIVFPTQGQVLVGNKKVIGPGPERSVVFQSPSLFPWRTVMRNITYGLELQRRSTDQIREVANRLLRLVGLQGFENHFPHELSGGMQQRVNLARALAVDPDLLLLDEPFAALDAQTREFMQSELGRIWQETSKTALFITHQIDEAVYLGDRVVVMSARPGRVRADIPIDLTRPRELVVKRSAAFREYEDTIWHILQEEFKQLRSLEPTQAR